MRPKVLVTRRIPDEAYALLEPHFEIDYYDKAKAILDKFAMIRPPMQQALDRLKDVPVDIDPLVPFHEGVQ